MSERFTILAKPVLGLLDDPKGVGYQVLTRLRGAILSRVRPQAS